MKKLAAMVFVVCVLCAFVGSQQKAAAKGSCNVSFGTVCGYFNDKAGSADDNVLPNGIRGIDTRKSSARNAQTFIKDIENYLNSGDTQSVHGAAFIIDNMLGYNGASGGATAGGGFTAGVKYAQNRANLTQWENLVNAYANANQINWRFDPGLGYFCSGKATGPASQQVRDSAYDASADGGDDVFYAVTTRLVYPKGYPNGIKMCKYAYLQSEPEISFTWNGGSFNIGTGCGNIQDSLGTPPNPNVKPSGTIVLNCDAATGQRTATIKFSDADGPTSGYVTVGSWKSGDYPSGPPSSPNKTDVPLPPPPTTDPFNSQTVTLHMRDVGPLAPPNTYYTATDTTSVPCATVGCSISGPTPDVVDPYMTFSITVSGTTNVGTLPPTARLQLKITPPMGGTYSYTSPQQPLSGGSVTFGGLGPTKQVGIYALTGTLSGVGSPETCSGSVSVVYLPYLNVYGGDVMTGSSPAYNSGVSTCSTDTNAGVFSWNNHSTDYSGAGAQYAVQTLAAVVDFASGLSSSNTPPVGLSFANTDPNHNQPSRGLFGGYYGAANNDCDFTSDITQVPTRVDMTLPAMTLKAGSKPAVVYVQNHDVYVSKNIVYGYNPSTPGGWTSISQIPSFRLVVTGGDIYIDRNVTQLDGLYVAEPVGSAGGRIFTCASGLRAAVDSTLPGSYTTCNKPLVINGAFVARYVAFGRTYGSLGQAKISDSLSSNHDAEIFNYTPELWLPRNAGAPDGGYASITGLPPVL